MRGNYVKILQNSIYSSTCYGINAAGANITITNSTVTGSGKDGIYVSGVNAIVSNNTATGNSWAGISITSSFATVNFNRITGNSIHGLYTTGNGTINAINNWWGTNNPIISSNNGSDICIASGTVTYNPWLNGPNTYPVLDINTGITYFDIQNAINNALPGDTIQLTSGNYIENIIINKRITLMPVPGAIVTIQALDPSKPVITLNSGGNGTTIRGFTVKGSNSGGIYLNKVSNCSFIGNILTNNLNGIYSDYYGSNNNIIRNNSMINNRGYGIYLYTSSNNVIQYNTITNNGEPGIYLYLFSSNNIIQYNTVSNNSDSGILMEASSSNNTIQYNTITNNAIDGITLESSSNQGSISFNRITGNSRYGLFNDNSGTITVTNNWWGSNSSPKISSAHGSDIFCYNWANINFDPWLMLNVTVNPAITNGNSTIIADLTHNSNGEDTSSQGYIYDVPVSFTTDLGTISSPVYTQNGKASATFNRGTATSGTAHINITADHQTMQTNITIDAITPTVTTNLAAGIYNATKTVTLTATDNMDSNPIIYYSTNNGSTWNHQANTVTLNLSQGVTNLMFYAVDTTGNQGTIQTNSYTIDTTAPTITVNHAGGLYNTYQNVTLTAKDNLDSNPTIYYTTDGSDPRVNGVKYTNPVAITNITTLRYVAVDAAGNWGSEYTQNYTIDTLAVTANPVSGIYNTTKIVTLTATDNLDPNPVIYYTLNGTAPTTSSTRYTGPITLQMNGNCNIINLKYMAVDSIGYQMPTQTAIYILTLPVVDINTNISYSKIQDAINNALNGDTIEIINGTFVENLVINKNLTIKSVSGNNVIITPADSSKPAITINSGGNGSIIQGLTINGGINLGANNCTISGNTITGNGTYAIIMSNSFNNTISNNTITSSGFDGIHSSYSNNIISNNVIYGCNSGIYSEYSNDSIISNNLTGNHYGIWTYNSTDTIHFNRITGNTYGLRNDIGTVNATNNWWGSNLNPLTNSSIIQCVSGNVIANPWLVLGVTVSPTNSGGNTSVTADLTHNSNGNDTSSQGHVPNGIPINFATTFGTIIGSAYTVKGKASTILNLGSTQNATVTATAALDNQTANATGVIATGIAVINITSTAIDSSTGQPLNITYNLPLNESVTWLSIMAISASAYSNTPADDLQVIVDGNVVLDRLIYAGNGQAIDTLTVNLAYPGVSGFNITVTDPNNSTNVTTLNFPGNVITRTSTITYRGSPYDGVQSFAIATTDVTTDIAQYWLNQGPNYQSSATMSVAYNTFLTSLLVEYTHDQIADAIAPEYNVTWSRTSPIVVSVGEDATGTYLTLDCDHSMGMTVIGALANMYVFNFITSSSIPFIEYGVMNSSTNGTFSSVAMNLINAYLNNSTSVEMFMQNGYLIEKSGNDFIVIDPETGICRDINIATNLCGVWDVIQYERWLLTHPALAYALIDSTPLGNSQVQGQKYINLTVIFKPIFTVLETYEGCALVLEYAPMFLVLSPEIAPGVALVLATAGVLALVGAAYNIWSGVASDDYYLTDESYTEQLKNWPWWIL